MQFEITGMVKEAGSNTGVPGVVVSAFDKDHFHDDLLGDVLTDEDGAFSLRYDRRRFRDLFERAPDIYLLVKSPSGKLIHTTEQATRFNAGTSERFDVEIPTETLLSMGLRLAEPARMIDPDMLTTFTCFAGEDPADDLIKEIRANLAGKRSILELMKSYMAELEGQCSNDAPPLVKLRKLFAIGRAPDTLYGHHYGITLGLRTGDLDGMAADYGNLLGHVWSAAIGKTCPWVGKTFTPMSEGDRRQVTGTLIPDDTAVFRGINHFNIIEHAPINIAGNALLNFMWDLKDATVIERLRYGHERNGGHFVAHRAPSVYAGTPREVFRLNYRFSGLDNTLPLPLLIDELVEIADGLYLGQLLFATARMFHRYDAMADDAVYHYQHFGYFLLMSEDWNQEAKRLFPHLEMPGAAVTARIPSIAVVADTRPPATPDKFTTLTLAEPGDGNVDPAVMEQIYRDLSDSGTVLRMIKSYADQLQFLPTTDSPVFHKLHTLFNAGIGPDSMDGYYPGALVSWQGQGLLGAFDINTINIAWQVSRTMSPWTGKQFDPVDAERLAELTGGHETMDVPTQFCANTVVFRTAREKFTKGLMKAMNLWMEDATEAERLEHGYDAKTFFFIGKPAPSIFPRNNGKRIYQLHYRWKALRNPPPDCLCIDELVQIAQGLYLGQVFYSTNPLMAWDPARDPVDYEYRLYEYFLLMDKEWHARRLRLGFDLENV